MFAEFSTKKITVAVLIGILLTAGVLVTYWRQSHYLEGFSASYYVTSLRNIFEVKKYQLELDSSRGLGTVASILLVSSPQTVTGAPTTEVAASIPVLLYHGVLEKPDGQNVTVEQFRQHMFALKKAGYQTVGIAELEAYLAGRLSLPPKTFVLTFDDGRKDSFYPVDPILEALDYKAIMFVIARHSLGPESQRSTFYLSEWELRRMLESGRWDIQSHGNHSHDLIKVDAAGTQSYFFGNKMWLEEQGRLETDEEFRDRIKEDLVSSKQIIEERLDVPVFSLAFPFGEFGQGSLNFPGAQPLLMELALSTYVLTFEQVRDTSDFSQNAPLKKPGSVARLEPKPDWDESELLEAMARGNGKRLPYFDTFEENRGWMRSWGAVRTEGQSLYVGATAISTGAFAVLDGTYGWRNYAFQAHIAPEKGSVFTIVSRYKNKHNYLTCKFEGDYVVLEQVLNGKKTTLAAWRYPASNWRLSADARMEVYDTQALCLRNGQPLVASKGVDPGLAQGGIGFAVWDRTLNNAAIRVTSVEVFELNGNP